ncbi:MAG: HD domain-containing protein, partial [Candidatus Heimdallarchaeota archaeon]|nr:HD domain-containing protein [Candidatus Heimdallarchaeota archaeon]
KNNCKLICDNQKKGEKKEISIRAMYDNDKGFWLKDFSEWSYFVKSSIIDSIVDKLKESDLEIEKRLTAKETLIEENMAREYNNLLIKNPEERINTLTSVLKRIRKVANSRGMSEKEKSTILMEATSCSYLINKITLDEVVKLADKDARIATYKMARLTEQITSSMTSILTKDMSRYTFFQELAEKSNGVTLRHMIRTFVLSYRFILYYNRELMDNGLASKTRVRFNGRFRSWYSSLVPHIAPENLTLENVFKGGMRPVSDEDIKVFSAGFLLHDIGKQRYMEYYEGDDDFDSSKVESHAKTGYRMLLKKTVYSEQIAAIAGFHHEYYGHESGYGYYRELCALMKLDNKNFRLDSCISYNLDDLKKFNSLAYFPVKFLEIVDVFDAITDPGRSYKSHLDTFDALKFMRREFVVNNKKIDLILFELFVGFLHEEEIVL